MSASSNAQLLWRVNNEYRRRLSQAQTYLGLLERLLVTLPQYTECLDVVRYTLGEISALDDAHRNWRYNFLYEDPLSRRVVQTEDAVQLALVEFGTMFDEFRIRLQQINRLLQNTDAPDERVTGVPSGNLWKFLLNAVDNLARFDEYVGEM